MDTLLRFQLGHSLLVDAGQLGIAQCNAYRKGERGLVGCCDKGPKLTILREASILSLIAVGANLQLERLGTSCKKRIG